MKASPLRIMTATAVAVLASSEAQAHLVATGMGPIYDGISHFGSSLEDILPVIAIGFFVGLRGPRQTRLSLLMLTLAWLGGGGAMLAGIQLPSMALPAATAALFLSIGGLLATNMELPPASCAAVAAAVGIVRGAADLAGVPPDLSSALPLVGMAASVFVAFALTASLTLPPRRLWIIVAVRVSGSWLAALGLFYAGWIIRYGRLVS